MKSYYRTWAFWHEVMGIVGLVLLVGAGLLFAVAFER